MEVSIGGSAGGSSRGALPLSRRKNGRRLHHVAPPPQSATRVVGLRGGSTAAGEERKADAGVVRSIKVLVATTKISSFVDAVREMQVWDPRSQTHTRVCLLLLYSLVYTIQHVSPVQHHPLQQLCVVCVDIDSAVGFTAVRASLPPILSLVRAFCAHF